MYVWYYQTTLRFPLLFVALHIWFKTNAAVNLRVACLWPSVMFPVEKIM